MSRQRRFGDHPASRTHTLSSYFKFCVGQLAAASLLAMGIPSSPANAVVTDYQVCAAELLRANVSAEQAARACSDALYPKDLSLCVLRITRVTPTISNDALTACTRVRRPVEMANCVVYISNRTESPEALSVLDHCRRSLLPVRFAECVIGLTREVDITPGRAMETCIAAGDYPRDLSPSFVPPPSSRPTLPPQVPQTTPDLTPAPTPLLDPTMPLNPQ